MKLLSFNEQVFVCQLFEGAQDCTAAARQAGYRSQSKDGMNQLAYRLMQSPRILAAIRAETQRRSALLLPKAMKAIETLIDNPARADHWKAVQLIHKTAFDQAKAAEVNVTINNGDREQRMERIRAFAKAHNLDLGKFLGLQGEQAEAIDAKFEEIPADDLMKEFM